MFKQLGRLGGGVLRAASAMVLALILGAAVNSDALAKGAPKVSDDPAGHSVGACGFFTATLGAKTFTAKGGGKDLTIKAADVDGKTLSVAGKHVAFMVDLGTFAISSYSVDGSVLYVMSAPEPAGMLMSDVRLHLDQERIVLERTGPSGIIKFHADDCNQGGSLEWKPVPAAPAGLVIHYELAPGTSYQGVAVALGQQHLVFMGTHNGFEAGEGLPGTAMLVSSDMQSSRWQIGAGGAVDTSLE